MPKAQLKLRSWRMIALAYVLGPLVGWTFWTAVVVLPGLSKSGFSPENAFAAWMVTMTLGGAASILAELLFVTPFLRGFIRHQWPWLNGWTAAAIGFLMGALPWFVLTAFQPTPSPAQVPGNVVTCAGGRCSSESWAHAGLGASAGPATANEIWVADGHWTAAGWAHVGYDALLLGLVGLITAVVFRLVAVRAEETAEV